MARPGENIVRTAAAAFMRQLASDGAHELTIAPECGGRFEIGGVDVLPAMAAALASVGAIDIRAAMRDPGVINNDGTPHHQQAHPFEGTSAFHVFRRADGQWRRA